MLFCVANIQSLQTTQLLACLRARGFCASPHIVSSPNTFTTQHPPVDVVDIVRTTSSCILRKGKALMLAESAMVAEIAMVTQELFI